MGIMLEKIEDFRFRAVRKAVGRGVHAGSKSFAAAAGGGRRVRPGGGWRDRAVCRDRAGGAGVCAG